MRTFLAIVLAVILAACGGDDSNNTNGDPNNDSSNNANNASNQPNNANNDGAGSCFHSCSADGPLGPIVNYGCVSPSSDGTCAADGQAHCEGLSWGDASASEYVSGCASCSESCAPAFYDCASAACATSVN